MDDVVMIAAPNAGEDVGQRFVVRKSSLDAVNVNQMTDAEFLDFVAKEAEAINPAS